MTEEGVTGAFIRGERSANSLFARCGETNR
jgi:hypothetical protein